MTEEVINVLDNFKVKGFVTVYAFPAELVPDYESYLKLKNKKDFIVYKGDNTISQIGFNLIPIVLRGGTNTISHCAVGTGSPTSTALGTEIATRVAITRQFSINNEYHIDTFYGKNDPDTTSRDLTETGLFNQQALGGDMYSSKTISFTKDTTVTMVVAWQWSFS